ncbi:MAG: RNA pseudouridine synthase [Ruminococcaceae bacterium]|nr:RNA pseudouridine synthase [Oscillospiraceae bacterium]
MITILHSDKDLLVCVKPCGTLSEKSEAENSLPAIIEKEYAERGEKVTLFAVHRLDREVRGVMVYAKTPEAAKRLSATMGEGGFEKIYLAVTEKVLEEKDGVLRDLLFKDSKKNKSYVVDRMRRGVKEASLEYSLLGEADGRGLYRIKLHTGRTHQIRVQLSSRGCPIVGDRKYGSRTEGDTLLCSYKLSFPHPRSNKLMEFTYIPTDGFGNFEDSLDLLRGSRAQ